MEDVKENGKLKVEHFCTLGADWYLIFDFAHIRKLEDRA